MRKLPGWPHDLPKWHRQKIKPCSSQVTSLGMIRHRHRDTHVHEHTHMGLGWGGGVASACTPVKTYWLPMVFDYEWSEGSWWTSSRWLSGMIPSGWNYFISFLVTVVLSSNWWFGLDKPDPHHWTSSALKSFNILPTHRINFHHLITSAALSP